MKIPPSPPDVFELLRNLASTGNSGWIDRLGRAQVGPMVAGKYRHWKIIRAMEPPAGLSHEEWWLAIKIARRSLYQELPLLDKKGHPFVLAVPSAVMELLHRIDLDAGGAIWSDEVLLAPHTRDTYLFNSLIEESINSSQLEGASTTRDVAKEMIRSGREPRTKSELMIYNNYQAMQFIREIKDESLTPEVVRELQRILTHQALDEPDAAGRFRHPNERIHIIDATLGNVLHVPPRAEELEERMQRLCAFANAPNSDQPFVHPVVRSILLHLWLAYDHPFVDGNGRTARALFYWSMSRRRYWLCEYISISRIIKKASGQYARAFLYTETDDNDATYFVLNQLRVILQAIDELHRYLIRKTDEIGRTRQLLQQSDRLAALLNHRELALVNHALNHPGFTYTIESHRRSHGITYQTARTDLQALAAHGLLMQRKAGKKYVFDAPTDLATRIKGVEDT